MTLKQVAAAAIRAVMHKREYDRIVQANRCNHETVGAVSPQWDKLVASRNELDEAVERLNPGPLVRPTDGAS